MLLAHDFYFFFFFWAAGATSLHSAELGFRTILIEDASRGIELRDMAATRESIIRQHGIVVNSDHVNANKCSIPLVSR